MMAPKLIIVIKFSQRRVKDSQEPTYITNTVNLTLKTCEINESVFSITARYSIVT